MTRILIADDHEVVRDGVRGFLERHTNYVVVAEAAAPFSQLAKRCG
jgi:DNA-binding NarL/FixJ family response regulator